SLKISKRFFDPAMIVFIAFFVWTSINNISKGLQVEMITDLMQAFLYISFIMLLAVSVDCYENFSKFSLGLFYFLGTVVFLSVCWHVINGQYIGYKELNEAKLSYGLFA